MKEAAAIVIVLVVVALSACVKREISPAVTEAKDTLQLNSSVDEAVRVTSVVLTDGTHCAVLQGYRGNALSCDWSKP